MTPSQPLLFAGKRWTGFFVLTQVAVMLLAISGESLWIDEFWTTHFAKLPSFKAFFELLLVPNGSPTPLHFLHFYLWGLWNPNGEFLFRLANLPLFVLGQLALFWALRGYPRKFAWLLLTLSALHPMVWQYANEARPYTMLVAGSQMMLAYFLHLHAPGVARRSGEAFFLLLFVLGGILLFGASLIGAFWVFAAGLYALVYHLRQGSWRTLLRGVNLLMLALFVLVLAVLTVYYLSSLLQGAGGSRLAAPSPLTVLFAAYEMLGLAGVGPSRLELRSLGAAAMAPYAAVVLAAGGVLVAVLAVGMAQARATLAKRELLLIIGLGMLPVLIVVLAGFVMHWRVLGRHLIAALPLLNLVLALGLARLMTADGRPRQWLGWLLAISALCVLAYSAWSLRFAPQHRKDDYRAAAALAQVALAQGKKVWWAAGVVGARYYGLPGDFDVMGELTGQHKPLVCRDQSGVQSIPNASTACLSTLSPPDLVILSKPETFDSRGDIGRYLQDGGFTVVGSLPAFSVWQRP